MGTIDLGNPTFLTFRVDMNTPAGQEVYDGIKLTIPEATALPPLGEQSDLHAFGVTVYGSTRLAINGDLEFLIGQPVDPAVASTDAIPVGGWTDQAARVGYYNQAKYLLGAGVTGAVLWPGLKNFYNWAQADLMAKGWTGPA
jgi:hypothetical protein